MGTGTEPLGGGFGVKLVRSVSSSHGAGHEIPRPQAPVDSATEGSALCPRCLRRLRQPRAGTQRQTRSQKPVAGSEMGVSRGVGVGAHTWLLEGLW